MKHHIILIVGFLICFSSFCQRRCDSTDVQTDRILLQKFWSTFREAINNKDKVKLASLCHFPFNCDYCDLYSSMHDEVPPIRVTKMSFDKSLYKLFFVERLIKEINKRDIPRDLFIFHPYFNTVNKKCSYNFNYIAVNENSHHPEIQRFFDIQQINGKFKIISTWTVP